MAKIEDCPGFETFGADVKAARKAKQLSRSALADMIHCDSRYLANIENEGTLPSLPVVIHVYTTQSMTLKHSRSFDTPVGRFEYKNMSREAFSIGITSINMQSYAFLMATPEKALCDLIANSPKVNLRYLKDVENYLEEDIRMEIDDFKNMDISIFERYAQVGKKSKSIETLIKYLRK